ncbi:MAG: flagellar FlaF family protein [Enterovirga sp.]|nr:flagellar FlaF family protein [Enterovirga sp.]
MQQAAHAYARASEAALSPRELEAAVLIKAASRLQAISDDWEGRRPDLGEALHFNQKLWTILVTSVTDDNNPVPSDVKQSIVDLAMFTFNRTVAVLADPEATKLTALVNINREVAAGLRANPPAQSRAA